MSDRKMKKKGGNKMKLLVAVLLFSLLITPCAFAQDAYLAWFTGASIDNSFNLATPPGAPALVSGGTVGNCLDLPTTAVGMSDVPLTSMTVHGNIGFWIRPKFDGKVTSGGSNHVFMKIGTPTSSGNGLQIELNNAKGVLRFIMVGKNGAAVKMTVIRADVSAWKSGDWHHVVAAWVDSDAVQGIPAGLQLWIDRVQVAGCIFGGTAYMNPSTMSDPKVYLGSSSASAYMDELIFRPTLTAYGGWMTDGTLKAVYRDYFRTAPYTALQVTNQAQRVATDSRAVVGYNKQFSVTATKTVNVTLGTTTTERITNFDGPGCWGEYDARDYITWNSSTPSRATVDSVGLVHGASAGTTNITAMFRGMTSTAYALTVVSASQPDVDLMYVEQRSTSGGDFDGRYSKFGPKIWPDSGEGMTSIVHYGNYGNTATAASFRIKFEKIPDTNGNLIIDGGETDAAPAYATIPSGLQPGATGTSNFTWTWPSSTMYNIRVTVDCDSAISEICEANNQRVGYCKGKAVAWGYGFNNDFQNDYTNRVMNLVGSFSDWDWCQAQVERMGTLCREAIYTTTSANGAMEACRVDNFLSVDDYFATRDYYDGGFEEMWDSRMALSPGNIHEMGHNTLCLQDLYGHPTWCTNLLLRDSNNNLYGGTPPYPNVGIWDDIGPWSSATFDYPCAMAGAISPLMVGNSLWLDRDSAGFIHNLRQTRQFIGDNRPGQYVPTTNRLQIYDVNDNNLLRAAVYVYQCVNTGYPMPRNKYYPDRQKMFGTTNTSGLFTFPTTTSTYWDDWGTNNVEGAVACATPFDRSNGQRAWAPSWQVGEMILLKIIGANGTEFHTLPLTEFNNAYLSGSTSTATYKIRTSLTSNSTTPTQQAPKTTYAGGEKPVSNIRFNGVTYTQDWQEVTTTAGSKSFDGSVSTDPESRPLLYRWDGPFGISTSSTYSGDLSSGDHSIRLFVIDGTCFSRWIELIVHVQ
jgi:hypothetical protein